MSGARAVAGQGGIFGKFVWTALGFGASSSLRFGLNIALAYLLSPAILGVMVVVHSVRLGIELLSDVGIEQNVIHHPDGLEPHFRDTAWAMQVMRGVMLSGLFAAVSPLLARSYGIDVRVFLVTAAAPMLGGLHSTAIYGLVKRLEVRRRTLFELSVEVAYFTVTVGLAVILRSVWAPVFGVIAWMVVRSGLSYLLPDPRQRFRIDPAVRRRILTFGKWIALTSVVTFAAGNMDRLVLGRLVPLALLGVYGIARAISDLPTTLARRLAWQIIFPAMSAEARGDGHGMAALARSRLAFVLPACAGLALAITVADGLIRLVYQPRYYAAGWMLAVLLCGGVFAILSNLNEALLLGAGKPGASSAANAARLATLGGGLVIGFALGGFGGAVIAVALTEVCYYGYIAAGLVWLKVGFWRQDAAALALALAVVAGGMVLRHGLGLGSPFAGILLGVGAR